MKFKQPIFHLKYLPYLLIFVLVIINWLFLSGVTSLAPPDYYKYYNYSVKLFSANFDIWGSLPLFPFLLGIVGNILSLFFTGTDSYILAGKLISLIASLGIIYFVLKFFRKLIGEYSVPATLLLMISPFYLKFISLPITDIVFLFFVVSVFYFIFGSQPNKSLFLSALAMLTRYEAILLVIPAIFYSFRAKITNLKAMIVPVLVMLSSIAALVYFSERLVKKISYILSNESYFFFLLNPEKLASLFYVNIFFFIPGNTPALIKGVLFLVVFGFFIYGYIYLFKQNKNLMLSILFYQIFFIISKGYISGIGNVFDPVSNTRRMLSIVFIFWFILILGVFSFIGKVRNKIPQNFYPVIVIVSVSIVSVITFYNRGSLRKIPLSLILSFMILGSFLLIFSGMKKITGIACPLILILLFTSIYSKSIDDSYEFVLAAPNKGAYMIAKWANMNLEANDKLLCYSPAQTVKYYLDKRLYLINVKFKDKHIYKNFEVLRKNLWEKSRKYRLKYIAFDYYMNPVDKPYEDAIKIMLERFKERNDYFRLKKKLFYRGRNVATIMEVQY